MQVLQAGQHKFIYLELQSEMVASIARQAGFETKAKDSPRTIQLDLTAPVREGPLLLFDAADPSNLGWFSRCQFYVDGRNGNVMQTPMTLANKLERSGKAQPHAVRLTICKELPATFRLPGNQPLTEQVFYHLFLNFLTALPKNGVAVCGAGFVKPLAGRSETVGVARTYTLCARSFAASTTASISPRYCCEQLRRRRLEAHHQHRLRVRRPHQSPSVRKQHAHAIHVLRRMPARVRRRSPR